jgi:hypothetical protein
MRILLSAGHGYTDVGSIGADKGYEKDRTLELANLIANKLKQVGHDVTVNTEKTSNGSWRFKNRNGYDYALSIHFNAFNKNATGVEVLYKNSIGKASEMSKEIANILGLSNRGAKQRTDLYMMNIGFDALIETCFHDNSKDLATYNNKKNEVANKIAEIINGGSITTSSKAPIIQDDEVNVYYKVKTQKHGWLPKVKNLEDYAGWQNSPIIGLAIKVDKGSIKYRVHLKNKGWLGYVTGYNINDIINGYAGNGKDVIDAVEVYYNTPNNIRPYKKAKYKVNNYSWQYDNEKTKGQDGYAGAFGVNATKFQIVIE